MPTKLVNPADRIIQDARCHEFPLDQLVAAATAVVGAGLRHDKGSPQAAQDDHVRRQWARMVRRHLLSTGGIRLG